MFLKDFSDLFFLYLFLFGFFIFLGIAAIIGIAYLIGGIKALKILGIIAGVYGAIVGTGCMINYLSEWFDDYKNEQQYKKKNPLIYYSERCNVDKVESLLKQGHDANEIRENKTPLISSFFYFYNVKQNTPELKKDSDKIRELLLDYGADPNLSAQKYNPGDLAISFDCVESFNKMVEHGLIIDSIDVNKALEDGINLKTAPLSKYGYPVKLFQHAVNKRSFIILNTLLDKKAESTIWADNEYNENETLIMKIAGFSGVDAETRISILNKIMENSSGCNIDIMNIKDSEGKTALHYACGYHLGWTVKDSVNNALIIKWLIDNGCEIDAVNSRGYTPIQIAVDYPWPERVYPFVKVFVENGADIKQKYRDGRTLLEVFIERNVYEKKNEYYPLIIELLTPKDNEIKLAKTEIKPHKISDSDYFLADPSDNW